MTGIADLVEAFAALMPAGPVTADDLRNYRVVDRDPLVAPIRSGTITTNPLPSLGGSIVAHVLGTWQPSRIRRRRRLPRPCRDDRLAEGAGLGSGRHCRHHAHQRGRCRWSVCGSDPVQRGRRRVFLPGTGMHLNNMMGEDDLHPGGAASAILGERIRSMMAPAIVDHHGGMLVLGTGGSERIRSALTRVITLLLGGDADLAGAVEAPRARRQPRDHPGRTGPIRVGGRRPRRAGAGHFVAGTALYFGGVNAVQVTADGRLQAHADPRRGGAAIVL